MKMVIKSGKTKDMVGGIQENQGKGIMDVN